MSKSLIRRLGRALGTSPRRERRREHGRVVRDINGFRMHLDLDDRGISRTLVSKGGRERCFMYVLEHEVREGMVCLDIGANLGYATLPMCREVGPTGFVYAIEPSAHNLELLRANIAENHYEGRCEVTEGLITAESGTMNFWISKHPNLGSVEKRSHSVKEVELKAYSLSDFFKARRPVDFIKMDVEGHEVEILRGALPHFQADRRPFSILFEAHPGLYKPEARFDEVLRGYVACGFHARYMICTPMAHPPIFKDAGYTPKHIFYSDNRQRGLYENVADEDMVRLTCFKTADASVTGRVRAVMLQRT